MFETYQAQESYILTNSYILLSEEGEWVAFCCYRQGTMENRLWTDIVDYGCRQTRYQSI